MIRKIVILIFSLVFLNGCSIIEFGKGLNYERTPNYKFEHRDTSYTVITNQKNGNRVAIAFRSNSCGDYGLIGPLIFPIIPFWHNEDCLENIIIGTGASVKNAHIIYHDKIYKPSEISSEGYYTFPLQTKSITNTAILVVEKTDGEIFKIPFRYQHTFSFDLFPGR